VTLVPKTSQGATLRASSLAFFSSLILLSCLSAAARVASAQVYNLKVVTDASPDYSDLRSLVHSATSRWESPAEKCWAIFYWTHQDLRDTTPMYRHGHEVVDPIMQFNDYGFLLCSGLAGLNNSIWDALGYKVRFYDVTQHTISECFYDGAWHAYDNSRGALWTLCDGTTIAGVADIGKTLGCAASGGKEEPGHIGKYHCLTGTSANGFLQGSDDNRSLKDQGEKIYSPKGIKFRSYYNNWERGHRYILNLRQGETYIRHAQRLGQGKEFQFWDKESLRKADDRYRIAGNGVRTWTPPPSPDGIYKIEGANVITSLKIDGSAPAVSISTDNGMTWKDVAAPPVKLVDEVTSAYEVLVKAPEASNLKFETITQVNGLALPRLNIGKNTIHVGAGEQTGSIVLNPELQADQYKPLAIESVNIKTQEKHENYNGVLATAEKDAEGHLTFKIDAPHDITRITQSARMYVRDERGQVRFEHSFDGGKSWTQSYAFSNSAEPWDDLHDQVTTDIPPGAKSVLFKYVLNKASLYSLRMEMNHKAPAATNQPIEVTLGWSERQRDYSLIERSHTQFVDKLPFTYQINVGGEDHPVMKFVRTSATTDAKAGYSDNKDVGGEKFVGKWVTYGRNLAAGKSYTLPVPSSENKWQAGDPDLKKLTDGVVGGPYSGGASYSFGPLWNKDTKPDITVDLGQSEQLAACRIHLNGYPAADALKGQIRDEIEVLTSADGTDFTSRGQFNFNLRAKDVPLNHIWSDERKFPAHTHTLILPQPATARYVRFKLSPARSIGISEVQVLDSVTTKPFDMKIALPEN
jgi:hypothetical protein